MNAYSERIRAEVRLVIGDRILEPGDVTVVDCVAAQMYVLSGRASLATPIRALRPDVLAGSRVLSIGEVGFVGEGLAVQFAREGAAELVEPEALSEAARAELGKFIPAKPVPPPAPEYPAVTVVAKEDNAILGNRVCQAGELVSLPEPLAVEKIVSGLADAHPDHPLSDRGKAYMKALKRRPLGSDDPEY
jgi:hypothetical protein